MDDGLNPEQQRNIVFSVVMIFVLFVIIFIIGLLGFRYFFGTNLIDSIYNTSMYISGMGPITGAQNTSQKLFASFFSIVGGLFFLAIVVLFIDQIANIVFFARRERPEDDVTSNNEIDHNDICPNE